LLQALDGPQRVTGAVEREGVVVVEGVVLGPLLEHLPEDLLRLLDAARLHARHGEVVLEHRQLGLQFGRLRELLERLVDNDQSRTAAIMNGSILLSAEWTVDQLADTILTYISAARTPDGSLRFGSARI